MSQRVPVFATDASFVGLLAFGGPEQPDFDGVVLTFGPLLSRLIRSASAPTGSDEAVARLTHLASRELPQLRRRRDRTGRVAFVAARLVAAPWVELTDERSGSAEDHSQGGSLEDSGLDVAEIMMLAEMLEISESGGLAFASFDNRLGNRLALLRPVLQVPSTALRDLAGELWAQKILFIDRVLARLHSPWDRMEIRTFVGVADGPALSVLGLVLGVDLPSEAAPGLVALVDP